jgi:hypothetical protein
MTDLEEEGTAPVVIVPVEALWAAVASIRHDRRTLKTLDEGDVVVRSTMRMPDNRLWPATTRVPADQWNLARQALVYEQHEVQLRAALHLEFAEEKRGSGRTTRMIARALDVVVKHGRRVMVLAMHRAHANAMLHEQIKPMALKVGLHGPELWQMVSVRGIEDFREHVNMLRGVTGLVVFVDHATTGHPLWPRVGQQLASAGIAVQR